MAVDKISSDKAKEIYDERLKTDSTRKHVLSIIEEFSDSVQFMDKVRKYASMEMDSRIFTSWKFWSTTISAAILSAVIGVLVTKYFT